LTLPMNQMIIWKVHIKDSSFHDSPSSVFVGYDPIACTWKSSKARVIRTSTEAEALAYWAVKDSRIVPFKSTKMLAARYFVVEVI
jgi:hypothetical protein